MKQKTLSLFLVSIAFLAVNGFFFLQHQNATPQRYIPRKAIPSFAGALQWQFDIQKNPETGKLEYKDVYAARESVKRLMAQKIRSGVSTTWKSIGPNNMGGRTRAILVDGNNSKIVYAGSVAGGLYRSENAGQSWVKVTQPSLYASTISAIAQDVKNKIIYVGTGENFANPSGYNNNTGSYGQGVWKSTDGKTFSILSATWSDPSTVSSSNAWSAVNALAVDQNNSYVYAATIGGLYRSKDKGTSWDKVMSGNIKDVKIASNGKVVIVRSASVYTSTTGDNGSFNSASGISASGRMSIAIAPSDPNYIYVLAAKSNGTFDNIYRSTDGGANFSKLIPDGTETLQPFGPNNQGWYDNIIAVFPDDKTKIIFGGVDLYTWSDDDSYTQVTGWYLPTTNPLYVHADQHAIVFDPNYETNKTVYFGCDGGVFKSINGAQTFLCENNSYSTIQFYDIGISLHKAVIGGAQDNGSIWVNQEGNQPYSGKKVQGGDGFCNDISMLRPKVFLTSTYNSRLVRSEDEGTTPDYNVFSSNITGTHNIDGPSEPFFTRFELWESFNDPYSVDTIKYYYSGKTAGGVEKDTLHAEDTIKVESNGVKGRYIKHILTSTDLAPYGGIFTVSTSDSVKSDSIYLVDPYQDILAMAFSGEVYVTREILDFSKIPPQWSKISTSDLSGTATAFAWSPDGTTLYFGDYSGHIFRTSGFDSARTAAQMDINDTNNCKIKTERIASLGGYISSIYVDPQNADNLIVTEGGYGNSNLVYYSSNATASSPSFSNKTGNLPKMPVYASIILWNDSKTAIIGTDMGVYATDDITKSSPTWTLQDNGIPLIPVYRLRQQIIPNFWVDANNGVTNHGYIYAATHGGGFFECSTYKGPVAIEPTPEMAKISNTFGIYPNPARTNVTINTNTSGKTSIVRVYNLKGQRILERTMTENTCKIDVSSFSKGVYVVSVNGKTQKLVVD